MSMIKWIRPSGSEIETNDFKGTIEGCLAMGWKRVDEEPEKKRRGPGKPKAEGLTEEYR